MQHGQSCRLRRDSLPPEMGVTVAVEGARGEIPKDLLSKRERGALEGTPQRSASKWRLPFFFFARLWAFLILKQEWLVSQAATEKCCPGDQREGHADQSQGSSSCHLLIESNGPQWTLARRKCRRREQKRPPPSIKLKEPLRSRVDAPSPSLISFHSWFSCSKEPKSAGCSLRKKIPVP